jgi:hypothetical protein
VCATSPPVPNNGSDKTRPRTQATAPYDFENLPGPAPDSSSTFTLRGTWKLELGGPWSVSLRVDVPVVLTNAPSPENAGAGFEVGFGNLLNQVGLIYTLNERGAFAAGSSLLPAERGDTRDEHHAASIATLYFNPAASSPSWMASRTNTDSG